MELPPPLLQERLVGHLLGEGVLERIRNLGDMARLVEELAGLQAGEAQPERLLGPLGDGLQERQGHLGADD
jgi:hypothetical protein